MVSGIIDLWSKMYMKMVLIEEKISNWDVIGCKLCILLVFCWGFKIDYMDSKVKLK